MRARAQVSFFAVAAAAVLSGVASCVQPREEEPKAPATAQPSGRLPQALSYYGGAGKGGDFVAFVNDLQWGAGDMKARRACPNAACSPGPETVAMRITAISDANSFNPANAGPNGAIVARLTNLGALSDRRYRTRPGSGIEYYLVVQQAGGYPSTWQVVELNMSGAAPQVSVLPGGGAFVQCGTSKHPHAVSDATFGGCTAPQQVAMQFQSIFGSLRNMLRYLSPPQDTGGTGGSGDVDNVSCDWGCCGMT